MTVVICGAGAAGLAAAVEAADAGAEVLVLEAGTEPGGSTAMSAGVYYAAGTSIQRAAGVTDSVDDMYAYYLTLNQWNLEPWLARRLCVDAAPGLEWLIELGVDFPVAGLYVAGVDRVRRGHKAAGGGKALVAALLAAAEGRGAVVCCGERARGLLVDEGRVVGVRTEDARVPAGAVVLASGGLGTNVELIREFYPAAADRPPGWPGYFGCPTNRGDGLQMGRAAGAAVVGHGRGLLNWTTEFSGDHPADFAPPWVVFVNELGRRFMDETAPYTVAGDLVRMQPGGRCFAILDEAARASSKDLNERMARLGVGVYTWGADTLAHQADLGTVHRAGTLPELAGRIGVRPGALEGTIAAYNADVTSGGTDRRFFKRGELRTVGTPPFYAVEVRPTSYGMTAAGLRIDPEARVYDEDERPIPGLFAAGEVAGGVFGDRYVAGGNAITNAIVYGRIAGRGAAEVDLEGT